MEKVAYIYSTYYNALKLLSKKDAFLPHVLPEYLLEYDDYVIYVNHIVPKMDPTFKGEPLVEYVYLQRHTQCWIDLLLQTYKFFSLSRITKSTNAPIKSITGMAHSTRSSATAISGFSTFSTVAANTLEKSLLEIGKNIYSEEERILLTWLAQNYHDKCLHLWPDSEAIPSKKIENFTNDLSDSIVLATVTAAYCPYLVRYLQDLYVSAEAYEQKYHNAIRLITAWEKINISFRVTPKDITSPVVLHMLMLVHHLYEVLPYLHPIDTFTLEAPITQTVDKKFEVENKSDAVVMYNVLIFDNEKNQFSLEPSFLKVPPRKTAVIDITYHARYLERVTCTMILTGDTQGYKYAKGLAYFLEGVPDPNFFNDEIVLTPHLYNYEEIPIEITSPYQKAAYYDIFIKTDPSRQTVDELQLVAYEDITKNNVPSIISHSDNNLYFNEEGKATCNLFVNPVIPANVEYHVYNVNKDIGTFSVKVKINTTKKRMHFEVIKATLPHDFPLFECSCSEDNPDPDCRKRIPIQIPCKNNLLWNCIERCYMARMNKPEELFWKKYFSKYIFRLKGLGRKDKETVNYFI